ncbi:MAG: hypothetical protein ABJL55_04840 [Roseibium sp.]
MRNEAPGDVGARYRKIRVGLATARYSAAFLGLMDFAGDFGTSEQSPKGLKECSSYHELSLQYDDGRIQRADYKRELNELVTRATKLMDEIVGSQVNGQGDELDDASDQIEKAKQELENL